MVGGFQGLDGVMGANALSGDKSCYLTQFRECRCRARGKEVDGLRCGVLSMLASFQSSFLVGCNDLMSAAYLFRVIDEWRKSGFWFSGRAWYEGVMQVMVSG